MVKLLIMHIPYLVFPSSEYGHSTWYRDLTERGKTNIIKHLVSQELGVTEQ
jgi:hypothetical protein